MVDRKEKKQDEIRNSHGNISVQCGDGLLKHSVLTRCSNVLQVTHVDFKKAKEKVMFKKKEGVPEGLYM